MSNDLRLNSLERFQKTSERLVLEEHGHYSPTIGFRLFRFETDR